MALALNPDFQLFFQMQICSVIMGVLKHFFDIFNWQDREDAQAYEQNVKDLTLAYEAAIAQVHRPHLPENEVEWFLHLYAGSGDGEQVKL